jgi:hypothetical protein
VTIAPWLIRNAIWYGNPVYPLVFEAAEMDAIRRSWYEQLGTGLLFTQDAWQVPILPIAATILGVEGGGAYGHNIGPLFLVLSPILVLSWPLLTDRERRALAPAAVFVGVITAVWILNTGLVSNLNQRTRFVFYMFPPLAVLAGVGLDSLRRWPTSPLNLSFVVRSVVVLIVAFTTVDYMQTVNRSGFLRYFSGQGDFEEDYLYHGLGWHYEAMKQVNALSPGSTVRFLWEPRYLYCNGDLITCRTDSLMDGWYYARRAVGGGDPGEIAHHWEVQGLDYFLVYEFGRLWEKQSNRFYEPADWFAWDHFVEAYVEEVWRGQIDDGNVQYVIYRWQD